MTGPSRIIVLTPRLDGMDGISEVSRQVVEALVVDRGAPAVEVWAADGRRPADGAAAHVKFFSAGGVRARLGTRALATAATRLDDVLAVCLHLHLAPLAALLRMRGARFGVFLHGIEAWRRLRARDRMALARANVLLANSHWTAAHFKSANPVFGGVNVQVCHLGVPQASTDVMASGFSNFALIVGRMDRHERYKGHDLLIEAWPEVCRAVPDARLVIAGDGTDRLRLEALASSRGGASRIVFAGAVSNAALAGLYRDAAFFVMPSSGEGFGLAYLEAMRAAKACIAAGGAAAEIVDDGVTGLLVDPESASALVSAVIRLFTDERLRERMGRAGAARVAAQFEHRHFARRLVDALTPLPSAQGLSASSPPESWADATTKIR